MSRTKIAFVSGLAALALMVTGAVPLAFSEMMQMPKPITAEGILVDTKCYGMMHDNVTNDHPNPKGGTLPLCALTCARMGIPVALLVDGKKGGQLYFLVTPATVLSDHMAKWARVTGPQTLNGSIMPEKLEVKNDKTGQYEEVKLGGMM